MALNAIRFLPLAAFFIAATVAVGDVKPSIAQDISESHLAAAQRAVNETNATTSYDVILLDAATRLKNDLTSTNPDQADLVAIVVDEEALKLAERRGALEREASRLFANSFSEAELNSIAEFFGSDTGRKYLEQTPILARELAKAARVWAAGITRDLGEAVNQRLVAEVQPATPAPAPAEGAAATE